MALSNAELQKLKRASLVSFYQEHKAVWDAQYKNAHEYVRKYITAPEKVRPDDIIEVLVPALQVTELLTNILIKKKLMQKYWVRYFADLIVDSLSVPEVKTK